MQTTNAELAQLEERQSCKLWVRGSNPLFSTIFSVLDPFLLSVKDRQKPMTLKGYKGVTISVQQNTQRKPPKLGTQVVTQ